jgi:hypothetical protein
MNMQQEVVNDFNSALFDFLAVAAEDVRISPVHISLYLAILHYYKKQDFKIPVSVYSRELMKQAKISTNTYHKCIIELHNYGFVRYVPSFNPMLGSLVYPLKLSIK